MAKNPEKSRYLYIKLYVRLFNPKTLKIWKIKHIFSIFIQHIFRSFLQNDKHLAKFIVFWHLTFTNFGNNKKFIQQKSHVPVLSPL